MRVLWNKNQPDSRKDNQPQKGSKFKSIEQCCSKQIVEPLQLTAQVNTATEYETTSWRDTCTTRVAGGFFKGKHVSFKLHAPYI